MPVSLSPEILPSATPAAPELPAAHRLPVASSTGVLPLSVSGVSYRVNGRELLGNINLVFATGGSTLLLGPNGAGKSLLLRLCHGLIQPSTGTITWLGPQAGQACKRQAMVFQRPLMLRRSVRANVEYPLIVDGTPLPERRRRVAEALNAVGLQTLANRNARVLSGGEQQRVALARAWVVQPDVLFLDEPSANLDPAATKAVEDIVARFRTQGITIIMTTHDLGQARRLADDIVFIHGGRVLEHRPAGDFFAQPRTREAVAFLRGELLW